MRIKPKRIMIAAWIVLLLLASYMAIIGAGALRESPFLRLRTYSSPSFVSFGCDKVLVIDDSKKRVTVLDERYEISATINGGVRSGTGFYYAEFAVTDGNYIYISDAYYFDAGTRVSRERIIRYLPDGSFDGIIYEVEYPADEMPKQKGNITYLGVAGGVPHIIFKDDHALTLFRIEEGGAAQVRRIDTAGLGDIQYTYYDPVSDRILFTTKNGRMFSESADGHELLSDFSGSTGDFLIWEFATDSAGRIYCTDIGSNRIIEVPGFGTVADVMDIPGASSLVYRLFCGENDVLAFTDNTGIFLMRTDGSILLGTDSSPFSARLFAYRIAVWLCAAFSALSILAIIVLLSVWLLKNNRKAAFRTALLLGFVIIVSSFFVTVGILGNTTVRISEKTLGTLKETVTSISRNSGRTIGDSLEKIRTPGDYLSDDYLTVREYLDVFCDSAYESGSNLFYVIYRHVGDNLNVVMDYENTIIPNYPYMPYIGSGYEDTGDSNEIVVVAAEADSYGYWAYAIAPIFNSAGETVGIIEIGSDLYGEQLRTRELIGDIVLSTAVLILVLLLVLSEGSAFAQFVSSVRSPDAEETKAVLDFIRPLAFLVFCAENFSSAFTPQLSEKLFETSAAPIPPSLGAAVPMSAQLVAVALVALFGGSLIDRLGAKKVILAGLTVQLSGGVLMAAAVPSGSYGMFVLGKVLTGCGLGASAVSMNSIPSFASGEERKNALFSGLNVGLMSGIVVGTSIGSYIADAFGYFTVFLSSSAVSLIAIITTAVFFAGALKRAEDTGGEEEPYPDELSDLSPVLFFFNRSVFSFLLFVMFPFLVMMYFKDYLFPLYASGAGFSDSYIGNILLFGGAMSIYFSPVLSKYSMKYLHAKGTAVLSSLLYIAALIAFALFRTSASAVIAVFVISVAGGFGLISHGVYYSSLRVVDRYGSGKAMGVFSLVDNLGQSAGPILFGVLMASGFAGASIVTAVSSFALLMLFVIMNISGIRRPSGARRTYPTHEDDNSQKGGDPIGRISIGNQD